MPLKKFGEGQVIPEEEDEEARKTAGKQWTEKDSEELTRENDDADQRTTEQ